MVAAGCSNKEIAGQCGISAQTIKHHLTRMFDKLGVSNRLELAMIATERGLVHAVDSEPQRQPVRMPRNARRSHLRAAGAHSRTSRTVRPTRSLPADDDSCRMNRHEVGACSEWYLICLHQTTTECDAGGWWGHPMLRAVATGSQSRRLHGSHRFLLKLPCGIGPIETRWLA